MGTKALTEAALTKSQELTLCNTVNTSPWSASQLALTAAVAAAGVTVGVTPGVTAAGTDGLALGLTAASTPALMSGLQARPSSIQTGTSLVSGPGSASVLEASHVPIPELPKAHATCNCIWLADNVGAQHAGLACTAECHLTWMTTSSGSNTWAVKLLAMDHCVNAAWSGSRQGCGHRQRDSGSEIKTQCSVGVQVGTGTMSVGTR